MAMPTYAAGVRLLPNAVTVLALCSGLSAVYFALGGRFELCVAAAGAAALCDALDGRLARLLDASTRIGAELDSLADLVSFGVSPALVLYIWQLQGSRFGWAVALVFAVCMMLRLARFNTLIDAEDKYPFAKEFFVGVPAPAAALSAGIPLYLTLHFGPGWWSSPRAGGRVGAGRGCADGEQAAHAVVQDGAGAAQLHRPAARARRPRRGRADHGALPRARDRRCSLSPADPLHRLPVPLARPPPGGVARAGARAPRGGPGGPVRPQARPALAAAAPRRRPGERRGSRRPPLRGRPGRCHAARHPARETAALPAPPSATASSRSAGGCGSGCGGSAAADAPRSRVE